MDPSPPTTERPLLNWDDIHVFLVIARSRTLSAAAPKLNLSQPTLGRRLKAFERLIGSPLFIRTADGLQLTTDGNSILSDAETMERSAFSLQRRLTSETRGLGGLLRIASRQWIMHHMLGVPLSIFARSHPKLTLDFVYDSPSLDLTRRDADIAFRSPPPGQQAFTDPDIIQRSLMRIQYDVFASRGYLAERGGWPTEGRGEGHRLIVGDGVTSEPARQEHWLRDHFPEAQTSLHSSCRDTQALACLQGVGLAVLPHFVGERLSLERLDIREKVPDGTIWLGYHRDLRSLERLRELIRHVVRSFQKEY